MQRLLRGLHANKFLLACILLAFVLLACAVPLISCGGVLPRELKALGSRQSVQFVTRHLYPELETGFELIWPRLGNPALTLASEDHLIVSYYSAQGAGLSVTANVLDGSEEWVVPALGAPTCDEFGLCSLDVNLPSGLPLDRTLSLCLTSDAEKRCQQGALRRFSETPDPLRFAVLADLHFEEANLAEVGGRVVRLFSAIERADPPIDVVFVVGDLADQGKLAEQLSLLEALKEVGVPVALLPGNHDFRRGNISNYLLNVNPQLDYEIRLGPYLFVALNTGPSLWDQRRWPLPGRTIGLDSDQLDWFKDLTEPTNQVEVVLLHAPPFSVAKSCFITRRRQFLDLASDNGVRLILAGHTHRNEVYDKVAVGQGLSSECEDDVPENRLPLTLASARSTSKNGGYRQVTLQSDGGVSYCWVDVPMEDAQSR